MKKLVNKIKNNKTTHFLKLTHQVKNDKMLLFMVLISNIIEKILKELIFNFCNLKNPLILNIILYIDHNNHLKNHLFLI